MLGRYLTLLDPEEHQRKWATLAQRNHITLEGPDMSGLVGKEETVEADAGVMHLQGNQLSCAAERPHLWPIGGSAGWEQ